jgi:thiol:disulfide interchange protein DsbD
MPKTSPAAPTRALARLVPGALALALAWAAPARAQLDPGADAPAPESLAHVHAQAVEIAAGGGARALLVVSIRSGWHINANPPSPDYMIPTKVSLRPAFGVRAGTPAYPAPKRLKVGFDPSPLAVYSEETTIELPLAAAPNAVNGAHTLRGRLEYQACNEQLCTPPVSVPYEVNVTVSGGAASASADSAGETPEAAAAAGARPPAPGSGAAAPLAPGSGFTTTPPAGGTGAALQNPVALALAQGGWRAFLTLMLVGLALNLTPCVYPMLGVTVSLFGAQRSRSPLASFGMAVVYVLGMASMYSTLGVVAALSGGLFGSALQSPAVSVGIGVLLVALALSMFGLYQLQPPPQLLARLGGATATSVAGAFLSGLVVGVFAAPCIGPPVVALLAVVAAKGDPWFGFRSFFTLSLGLGLPYLVLGTFSNLLRKLPRSGEWMVWVERLFGVILFSVGVFYALLGVWPRATTWVPIVALVLGGIYLGFVETSVGRWRGFVWLKRLTGAAAVIGGVALFLALPKHGLAFEPYAPEAMNAALATGTPAMLDFSADWCVPCRELEHATFTDPRVIAAAAAFRTYRVDLTRYDSPDAERWRRQYAITGVPTVVFLAPGGGEVREARVEGFLPPDRFLERMRVALGR